MYTKTKWIVIKLYILYTYIYIYTSIHIYVYTKYQSLKHMNTKTFFEKSNTSGKHSEKIPKNTKKILKQNTKRYALDASFQSLDEKEPKFYKNRQPRNKNDEEK